MSYPEYYAVTEPFVWATIVAVIALCILAYLRKWPLLVLVGCLGAVAATGVGYLLLVEWLDRGAASWPQIAGAVAILLFWLVGAIVLAIRIDRW